MHKLKVGDTVVHRNFYRRQPGRITVYSGERCQVQWEGARGEQGCFSTNLIRLCNNCHLPAKDHADGGKCLYAPTTFE